MEVKGSALLKDTARLYSPGLFWISARGTHGGSVSSRHKETHVPARTPRVHQLVEAYHSCPAPHSSAPTRHPQWCQVGIDRPQATSINGCPHRAAGPAQLRLQYDPATRARMPKAPWRSSPHCDSVATVGGGGLMVLRGRRQRRRRYRARLKNLQPSEGNLVRVRG